MSDQFLKDIEADIAKLNAALEEISDEEEEEGLPVSRSTDTPTVVDMDDITTNDPAPTEEELDIPDLENMMKDHAALLLKIDNILIKNAQNEDNDMSEYTADTNIHPSHPSQEEDKEEEEEEEEDYFKGMNNFVENEEIVDTEKLYDLLEVNLNYQDFLFKLSSEIEKRLEANRAKQKELSEAEDMKYLVSKGYTLSSIGGQQRSPHTRVISLQRFKPPYFTNSYRHGPLKNPDQMRLSNHPRNEMYLYESTWGKVDRQILLNTIKDVIVEQKMTSVTMTQDKEAADDELERLKAQDRDSLIKDAKVDTWGDDNWKEAAMRLSASHIQRSRFDCHLQWYNYLSPSNYHAAWTSAEDKNMMKLVKVYGVNSWSLVAQKLGTKRKGWQCLQRYSKIKPKPTTQWTAFDDKHLQEAVNIYGDQSFSDLSYYMGDKDSMQCLQRWRYSICPTIKRGKWTQAEDEQIIKIVDEFGFDWQKIKDVQKNRTRAQVKERLRILTANKRAGSNGGTYNWTMKESIELMKLVQKHGDKNWSGIREDMDYRYTAPLLFRRWNRINGLLTGTCKRIMSTWEKLLVKEILLPEKHLTPELQILLKHMLPTEDQRILIHNLLSCFVNKSGKSLTVGGKGKSNRLKRKIKEEIESSENESDYDAMETQDVSSSDEEEQDAGACVDEDNGAYDEIRRNAGNIYQQAFKAADGKTGGAFKMCYTPPSLKTVSAFQQLLCTEYPKLKEQAGLTKQPGPVTLPEEVLGDEEFKLLAARFKSLFSWPLIMGETPVV